MDGVFVCLIWSTLGQQIGKNNPCFPCFSMRRPKRQKSDNYLNLQCPLDSSYVHRVPQKGMMTIWPK
jgi:hypothetical protein